MKQMIIKVNDDKSLELLNQQLNDGWRVVGLIAQRVSTSMTGLGVAFSNLFGNVYFTIEKDELS